MIVRSLLNFLIFWAAWAVWKDSIPNLWWAGPQLDGIINFQPYVALFFIALQIVFFPVVLFFVYEFWKWILTFWYKLAGKVERATELSDKVVVASLSSYCLNALPILGDFLQSLSFFLILYAGIRKTMGVGPWLSFFVLVSPVFLVVIIFQIFLFLTQLLPSFSS